MDFIERVLGLNPDQGSGLVELVFVAIAMAIAMIAFRVRWRVQKE
jgi:hypothetical protein